MAKFIKSLQIEEIVLGSISLLLLVWLYFLGFFSSDIKSIFAKGAVNVAFSFQWLATGIIIGTFLLLIAKQKQIMSLFRTLAFIISTSTIGVLTLGMLQLETKNRLINLQLINADKFLANVYPLFWLHSSSNWLSGFFNFLTPAIIYSFLSLAGIMAAAAFIFYFGKDKSLFKGYVMCLAIVFVLAMPFWFFFPANSPANYFLHNDGSSHTAGLSEAIGRYRPNAKVAAFQENMWLEQKNSLPITTMPSMHWAWSIIIVYYLFKKSRKTLAFSSVWLVFDLFGTVYLGNHYLADGLVAVPLAVLSIFLANSLIKLEKCRR